MACRELREVQKLKAAIKSLSDRILSANQCIEERQ